jgi:hypothetical protein
MYCPSCGSEISVELKYCNRCGANLTAVQPIYPALVSKPVRLALPTIVLGLMVTCGIGIILESARNLAGMQLHPAALTWIVIFSMLTLFSCTVLLLRFWWKVVSMNREAYQPQQQPRLPAQMPAPMSLPQHQLPPRLDGVPSVTEHTTRTFSPAYTERSDRGTR